MSIEGLPHIRDIAISVFIFVGLCFGSFCAALANAKNRDPIAWFILGLSFNFLALISIISMPRLKLPLLMICPKCQTEIRLNTLDRIRGFLKCPECDTFIDEIMFVKESDLQDKEDSKNKDK